MGEYAGDDRAKESAANECGRDFNLFLASQVVGWRRKWAGGCLVVPMAITERPLDVGRHS
jgi:hypothetical protein